MEWDYEGCSDCMETYNLHMQGDGRHPTKYGELLGCFAIAWSSKQQLSLLIVL